jgi:hypothetical protein
MVKTGRVRKDFSKDLSHERGAWISYQMKRRHIRQLDIARTAGMSRIYVGQVIWGLKRSALINAIVSKAIGYSSWEHLLRTFKNCT